AVGPGRGQQLAVGGIGQAQDDVVVAVVQADALGGRHVPDADQVAGQAGELLAVRRKEQSRDHAVAAELELRQLFVGGQVPDPDVVVLVAHLDDGQQPAVGGKGQGVARRLFQVEL